MWVVEEQGNDILIDCHTQSLCPFDGSGEKLLTSKLLNFDLVPGSGEKDAHAIDMECRCQECGHWDIFGVALSESEHNKLYAVLNMGGAPTAKSDLGQITGMMINQDALGTSMDEKWEKTNDPRGHKPKFAVTCIHCKNNGYHENMFFRYSYIAPRDDEINKIYGALNQIEYKCKKCAWTTKFLVEAGGAYLTEIMDMREKAGYHRHLYYMPPEEWNEDKEIEKQLAALGYCGGREDI